MRACFLVSGLIQSSCPMRSRMAFFNAVDHIERLGFEFRREDLGDIRLTERFAEIVVGVLHATPPAWLLLLGAAQIGAVETEILIHERLREERRIGVGNVKAEISLPVGERLAFQQIVHLLVELWRLHIHDFKLRIVRLAVVRWPSRSSGASCFERRSCSFCVSGCKDCASPRASMKPWPARFPCA